MTLSAVTTTEVAVNDVAPAKMAAADVTVPPVMQNTFEPIQSVPITKLDIKPIIDLISQSKESFYVEFNPAKHLDHTPPEQVITMKDIGFGEDQGVSPVAVSQPFPLFSKAAVQQMRSEVLNPKVMENCKFQSNIAACQLRGYAPKYAPFTYDAWTHPETLAIVSKIAGIELVPVMDYEIGHINISAKSGKQTQEELATIARSKRAYADDEGIAGCPWEEDMPVVGWHRDSYPFVCVLMLSDCTNMVGGETALRTGTGDILKVRGPEMGCAVILQGRYINHQALRALGTQERITSVTSFRAKSPFVPDDSVLTTVRPVSDLSGLYYGYGTYRLEMMEERIRAQLKSLREMRMAGKKFPTQVYKKFIATQEAFLKHTMHEIVDEETIVAGVLHDVGIPQSPSKRMKPE